MMLKLQFRAASLSLLALSIAVTSCRSTDNPIDRTNTNNVQANVKINLLGVENRKPVPLKQASVNNTGIISEAIQKAIIPFDGETSVIATLTPETSAPGLHLQAATKPMKASTSDIKELKTNTKYKILVYNKDGKLVDQNEFSYSKGTAAGFMLNGDETYTFIGYSVNNTSMAPTADQGGVLSTAKLTGRNDDLMYFKKVMTVTGNKENNLDVILKHQFSQINTKIDARQVGNISDVKDASIAPVSTSADLSFANSKLTYNGSGSKKDISFSGLNQPTVTTGDIQFISDSTKAAVLNIGTVTLDGVTKNMTVRDIKITPGVKYNLNLRFGPCRENVEPKSFRVDNGTPQTFEMPATDFGFVFDIHELDNSFSLIINGTPMATNEIQFEAGNDPVRNIRFKDGTIWGVGGIPQIYSMTGTQQNPLVRVVISKDGNITMFGSKTGGGPLFPLELTNGVTFNKVKWNTTSPNTVKATQLVRGKTLMYGYGTGKRIVNCQP
ncbi:hypothetical protein FCL53_02415 [Elizabethkingia meningoseptica]|nr:hypothetical protein [Elizabethkingia meningoseptica]